MRKVLGMALIALMVMLVASCDSGIQTPGGASGASGDGLVEVSISTSGDIADASRSLTATTAKADGKFMEVIFRRETTTAGTYKYYRAVGYVGLPLSIKLPVGSFTDAEAIMLIGRQSDNLLLAVGVPTATITITAGGGNTAAFTVSSLVSNLVASTASDFQIVETSFTAGDFSGKTSEGFFFGTYAPCFQVPLNTSSINATLTIRNFSVVSGASVFLADTAPTVTFTAYEGTAISGATITPASGAVGTGVFTINFTTTAAGKHYIDFNIPVVGFNPPSPSVDIPNRITWHISGGTVNNLDFDGGDNKNIALIVTNDADQLSDTSITTPTFPGP